MAKTAKAGAKIPKIPDIYKPVIIDKGKAKYCLVRDTHDVLFLFKTAAECHIVSNGIKDKWSGFDQFEAEVSNATLAALHERLFKALIPEGTDHVNACLMVWMAACASAEDRTRPPETANGKVRLKDREYELTFDPKDEKNTGPIKTPQALACLRILRESVNPDTRKVREKDLQKIVMKRQDELHTKQDPWRIFQYYRPEMVKHKLVRLL